MPTNAKTKTKKAADRKSNPKSETRRAKPQTTDAIQLLKHDHRDVEELFEQYEDLKDGKKNAEKQQIAEKICMMLKVHTQIEEEIFYPAARKATGDEDLLDEAAVEHGSAKHLIEEIESMKVNDDLYDAKIRVLSEQIRHHVEEEEEELFPELENSKADLAALGQELSERKAELMEEAGAAA